uniref:Putative secreted protein n=1 Tax=Ixodes ricinus TaxID=34613 RepID=A0A6B0TWH3_IXORI
MLDFCLCLVAFFGRFSGWKVRAQTCICLILFHLSSCRRSTSLWHDRGILFSSLKPSSGRGSKARNRASFSLFVVVQ